MNTTSTTPFDAQAAWTIWQNLEQAICVCSPGGQIHWSNKAFQALWKPICSTPNKVWSFMSTSQFEILKKHKKTVIAPPVLPHRILRLQSTSFEYDGASHLFIQFFAVHHHEELDFIFQQFIDSLRFGIYLKDHQNNILRCNQSAAQYLNSSTSYIPDSPNSDGFPDLAAKYLKEDLEVIRTNNPVLGIVESCTNAQGETQWMEVSKIPFQNQMGKVIGLFGIVKDVTHLRKSRMELADLQAKINNLNSSNIELERYAAKASHDMKGPLRTLSGFLYLLEKNIGDSITNTQQKYISYIKKSLEYMDNMIYNKLDHARLQTIKFCKQRTNTSELISEVCQVMEGPLQDASGHIQTGSLPPTIFCDPDRIKQLFQNLISNAIKFHRPNTPAQISITGIEKEDCYQFSVRDNGIGIPPEQQKHIFNIYHTGGLQRKDSTGIGLATCLKIVQGHRGKIWVESQANQGTTFRFTLAKSS